MTIFHFTAFAKQRIGFVEEQDCSAVLGRIEHPPQILFGLADIFADHRRQIDAIKIQAQFIGDHFGGHGFSCAAVPGEQCADAKAATHFFSEAPFLIDRRPLRDLFRDVV